MYALNGLYPSGTVGYYWRVGGQHIWVFILEMLLTRCFTEHNG
jgi:hypothetical protein